MPPKPLKGKGKGKSKRQTPLSPKRSPRRKLEMTASQEEEEEEPQNPLQPKVPSQSQASSCTSRSPSFDPPATLSRDSSQPPSSQSQAVLSQGFPPGQPQGEEDEDDDDDDGSSTASATSGQYPLAIEQKIATFFEGHRLFWDMTDPDYKDRKRRNALLKEFADQNGLDRKYYHHFCISGGLIKCMLERFVHFVSIKKLAQIGHIMCIFSPSGK